MIREFIYELEAAYGEEVKDPIRTSAAAIRDAMEAQPAKVPRPVRRSSYGTPGRGQQGESSN